MSYKEHTLSNGMRIYWDPMPDSRAASIGIWVRAGSRFEKNGEGGMTHFLEHMCFKGTTTRNAEEIANEMDFLGGEMNAFTSQEVTSFYATVLTENAVHAGDLLGDLLTSSVFDPVELERERAVVLEELAESKDDPEDRVMENLFRVYFGDHPFGAPILGTEQSIGQFSQSSVRRYFEEHYHPGNMFVTIAGNVHWNELIDALEKSFHNISTHIVPSLSITSPVPAFSRMEEEDDYEQVHLCIGLRGLPQPHPLQTALRVLSTHLGGGMSSRLFQEVREKRGLAYSVFSSPLSFSDGGIVRIAASTRPSRREELTTVLVDELRRLETVPLTAGELTRSKNQLKSSLLLGLESAGGRMSKMGRDLLNWGREIAVPEIEQWIDQVTAEDILHLVHELNWGEEQAVSVLGPLSGK
ncbi:MAG: insulinase family protein [Nitrospirae bacterium]|jgi:predicted Zn-dependent peptidase|nr:insulinase family protein [Nitrospirota bacterium]